MLPFVPVEVRTQLRFAKRFAQSVPNLRYLDQIREETQSFVDQQIKLNYFNGENTVSLDTPLGVAEALFNAGDDIKAMAESGQLQELHTRCSSLHEQSEKDYISQKDKIESIIQSIQLKEDELYKQLNEEYDIAAARHDSSNLAVLGQISQGINFTALDNLMLLDEAMASEGHELQ